MEYQRIINFLDNTSNQVSKFRIKNWIEINDQSRAVNNTNRNIRFKTTMLKSILCDYKDAYILVKERITISGEGADVTARLADERNTVIIYIKKNATFINCKSEINNTEIDNDKDIAMPIYNVIEYSDNYLKTSGSLFPILQR